MGADTGGTGGTAGEAMVLNISHDPSANGPHNMEGDPHSKNLDPEELVVAGGLCQTLFCEPYDEWEELRTDCLCMACHCHGYGPCVWADTFSNNRLRTIGCRRFDQVWLLFCCGRASSKARRSASAVCAPLSFLTYVVILLIELICIMLAAIFIILTFPVWLVVFLLWYILSG